MSQEKLAEYVKNLDAFIAQAREFDATNVLVSKEEGQWSAAFVMHHVADAELQFATRYFNALTIASPPIIPFDEDAYPTILNYEGRDWSNSISVIESIGNLVRVALNSISNEQWQRSSIHPEAGELTVSFLISKACNHMAAHTEQLKSLI